MTTKEAPAAHMLLWVSAIVWACLLGNVYAMTELLIGPQRQLLAVRPQAQHCCLASELGMCKCQSLVVLLSPTMRLLAPLSWIAYMQPEEKEHEAAAQAHPGLERLPQSGRGYLLTGSLLMVSFVLAMHSVLVLPVSCIA